jgi:putative drug exporter of the RND superfamily
VENDTTDAARAPIIITKGLGLGTALAVLIDATIIRALLVPSLMRLPGRWNWPAPFPLPRLHAQTERSIDR